MHTVKRLAKSSLVVLFFVLAFCVGALFTVYVKTLSSIYASVDAAPHKEVAIVLGASIRSNGSLSPVLQERADTAYALYVAKKVSKILVTGDNATLQYNEVYPVGKYLLAKGIPKEDIFLDYAGFDTYSSMYRAKEVFGVSSAIVVSQRFHLPRALYVAEALGISSLGVDAGLPGERYISNTFREIPASLKAVFDVVSSRMPKYLGPHISIQGSGTATWVGPEVETVYFPKK